MISIVSKTKVCIALDAMGGDFGPSVVVPAALETLAKHSNITLILVGNEAAIETQLLRSGLSKTSIPSNLKIKATSQVIEMGEPPAIALRNKRDSSMRIAIDLVKEGTASACVSAGNTGALMAIARFVLKTLPGIDRPAIVYSLPALKGHTHVLDLGANVDCTAEDLFQFAVMGSVLVTAVDNIPHPKVGLLNVGSEAIKGSEAVKRAAKLLSATVRPSSVASALSDGTSAGASSAGAASASASSEGSTVEATTPSEDNHPSVVPAIDTRTLNYIGFVEGDDIYKGTADVVVCDGFVGNVALKTSEGLIRLLLTAIKQEFSRTWYARFVGLFALPVLGMIKKRFDPNRHNGASLLGLRGTVIKSHGGADQKAFERAINVAILEVEKNIPELIKEQVAIRLSDLTRDLSTDLSSNVSTELSNNVNTELSSNVSSSDLTSNLSDAGKETLKGTS